MTLPRQGSYRQSPSNCSKSSRKRKALAPIPSNPEGDNYTMTRKMAPNQVPVKSVIGRASNMIVLAVIFALTACLSMSLHLVFGKSTRAEVTSADLEQVRREARAAIPRLPADTEDRLAAALYPQLAPIANISDPFVDRAGVASSNGAGNVSPLMVRTSGTTINKTVSAIPATPAVP